MDTSERERPALASHALLAPHHLQSPEARMLGEALVATVNAHLQRYPTMSWAEVRAVLSVLERAVSVEVQQEQAVAPVCRPPR